MYWLFLSVSEFVKFYLDLIRVVNAKLVIIHPSSRVSRGWANAYTIEYRAKTL